MDIILAIASALGALLVGAMSPGPSFVLVARTAMAVSRTDGLLAAVGMGVGGALFSLLALFGLQTIFAAAPWLYLALKLAGALYLTYLGARIWRGAKERISLPANQEGPRATAARSFGLGLFTQLSNPKTAIVYASIFAALLPHDLPHWALLALPFLVFLVETGWYCAVALVLSSAPSSAAYLGSKKHIDRVAGGIMGLLGLKLLSTAGPVP